MPKISKEMCGDVPVPFFNRVLAIRGMLLRLRLYVVAASRNGPIIADILPYMRGDFGITFYTS